MAVELRQLRYLVAVADAGQLSLAARRLHLSQPALSQAIRSMERELGVELLQRQARGVELTAAGRDVLAQARTTLAAADDVAKVASAHAGGGGDELVVGFLTETFAMAVEPVQRFARLRPDVRLRLRELTLVNQDAELREGRVDVALLCPPPRDLPMHPLSAEPITVTMSDDHPLADRTVLRAADVGDATFPGVVDAIPEAWADIYWLTEALGERPRRTAQRTATPHEVYELVLAGVSITTSPQFLARRFARGALVALPLIDVEPVVVGFSWRRRPRAVVRSFIEALAAAPPEPEPVWR